MGSENNQVSCDEEEAIRQQTDALAFYANPDNWRSPSTGFAAQYDPEPSPVDKDQGERARVALLLSKSR
jgi:hypothetical protein